MRVVLIVISVWALFAIACILPFVSSEEYNEGFFIFLDILVYLYLGMAVFEIVLYGYVYRMLYGNTETRDKKRLQMYTSMMLLFDCRFSCTFQSGISCQMCT